MAERVWFHVPSALSLVLLAACGGVVIDDPYRVPDTACGGVGWVDADGDGYGDAERPLEPCETDSGLAVAHNDLDCDDGDEQIHPDAVELCNDRDDNCNGVDDEGFDSDGDGYLSDVCPGGRDCDDADPDRHPGVLDVCEDGLDADCDGRDPYCGFEETYQLGDDGITLWAPESGYDAGRRIDTMDVDGDGDQEVLVSAMWANGYRGGAWLLPDRIHESGLFDESGHFIAGDRGTYEGGRALGLAEGTGDGIGDLLFGAPESQEDAVFVLFGPVTGDMSFSDSQVRLSCISQIECGHGADFADVDGDGVADMVIGAGEESTGGTNSGSVYLLHGPLVETDGELRDVAEAEIYGESAGIETGRVVMAGGDLNGDGFGDILASASYDSEGGYYAGAVRVVHGPRLGLSAMADSEGKLIGEDNYDYAGEIIGMGDVNGDGLSDALVAAYVANSYAGAAYVVYGPATGSVPLETAHATLRGAPSQQLGSALASRDVDGDGVDDLLVGAAADGTTARSAGAAYLYFGPLTGSLETSDAAVSIYGQGRDDAAGGGVGLGDLNGDGTYELLIGAPGDATNGAGAGALSILEAGG